VFAGQYGATGIAGGNTGATPSIDWNSGNVQSWTVNAACTFTLNNPIQRSRYILILTQSGAGGFAYTWPASVKWPSGSAPIGSATGKTDVISLIWDGTNYWGSYAVSYQVGAAFLAEAHATSNAVINVPTGTQNGDLMLAW